MPAAGKHAPFHLWILIVAWVLQLIFLFIEVAIYAVAIVALSNVSDGVTVNYAGIAVGIVLVAICIILNITEIVMCGRLRLTALFYLISNVVKSVIWVALVVVALVRNQGYNNYSGDYGSAYTGTGIGLSVCMMLLFLIPMLYGAIVFHKYGRRSVRNNDGQSYSLQGNGNAYNGAPVPRPEYVDVEGGFQKQPNVQQNYS